jgi:hypothetical protein
MRFQLPQEMAASLRVPSDQFGTPDPWSGEFAPSSSAWRGRTRGAHIFFLTGGVASSAMSGQYSPYSAAMLWRFTYSL